LADCKGKHKIIADASNGLSYTRMNTNRDKSHPREMILDSGARKVLFKKHRICFGTKTGLLHCATSRRASDLSRYGLGIVLYFQMIKFVGLMMFIFSAISMWSFMVFSSAGGDHNDELTGQNSF
jgi:hypothetical protein